MNEGIAIIGLSGRFPGAHNVAQFWENLCAGRESIATFTNEQLLASGVTAEEFNDPSYVRRRAVLDDPAGFDPAFFGITPREAELTDPQQRIFLECCWEALEDAGQHPQQSGSVGVYASCSLNTYLLRQVLGDRRAITDFTKIFQADGYSILLGADKDYLATRVAFKLNLRGPALTIQTACSSSLVAVAQACASLQAFQCDTALAGGVSLSFPQERGHFYQEGAIPSADGHCRAFDAGANGTVFGAGCGVVLLKRLEDAVRDGNHVYAIIRSTALNNDGGEKMSDSAPSQEGQAEVIALAHALAGISADSISYVEAHGTGTPLGDPIEVAALSQAFRATTDQKVFCGLGSLKTNIGHLEAAAGVTGLIKVALALKHRFLPATLHFKTPNPDINFADSPFQVVAAARPWDQVPLPRRAGVSSFGVGGTNAHAVVEEAPTLEPMGESRPYQLLLLSAKTPGALDAMTRNLADWLATRPGDRLQAYSLPLLADVAFTLQRGRETFGHRRVVVAGDTAEAVASLRTLGSKSTFTGQAPANDTEVVFLFPGQGAQCAGMGQELYAREPVYRAEVDRCAEILRQRLGLDIREVLYPSKSNEEAATRQINETWITQPAIFVVEYALAKLWLSWGIKPAVLIGHSIGEYVCAVLAGTFTLDDALSLLAVRAKLMHSLSPGSMLAVRMSGPELEPLLPNGVVIAAFNSAKLCTLSGPTVLLKKFHAELEARKIAARFLSTSHAFHSAMMDPILSDFAVAAAKTPRLPPTIPWISTCTGQQITTEDIIDAGYWGRQLREPVRFTAALDTLFKSVSHPALLEVGPGQSLSQLVRQHPHKPAASAVVASIATESDTGRDLSCLLFSLGRLWVAGVKPDWESFYAGQSRRRLSLPTYAFERKNCWFKEQSDDQVAETHSATLPENGKSLESTIFDQLSLMARQLDRLKSRASTTPVSPPESHA